MERKIIITEDGSNSISIPELNVTYHSVHGAILESKHIFIEKGLLYQINQSTSKQINIFEMGFGTGLNALLTLIESEKLNRKIYYETIELFPVENSQIKLLNYCELLQRNDLQKTFEQLHHCDWEKEIKISETFYLHKTKETLQNYKTSAPRNLIYFDAFDPNAQPELWTEEIFKKMFSMLEPGGLLVTYSSKGTVRRAMRSAGFIVEKLPGPPGKREIIRCRTTINGK